MSDLLGSRDILYPASFDRFDQKRTFSTDAGDCTSMRFFFAFRRNGRGDLSLMAIFR